MNPNRLDVRFCVEASSARVTRNREEGIVEGYASIFGNVDSCGSIIEKGAFAQTLEKGLNQVKVLWNHDPDQPIGKLLNAYEDERGLFVRFKLSLGVAKARDVFNLIQDGVIDAMSFGFSIGEDTFEKGIHVIRKVDLWDISPVTFPANSKALITSARAINEDVKKDIEDIISDIQHYIRQYGS